MGIGKRNILSRIILVLLVFIVRRVDAQPSPFDPVLSEEASSIREHVVVYTDRSLYITGEKVRFRGVIGQEGLPEYLSWSTVLYVELVSVSGSQVAGGKYPLINRVSAGEVAIPGDLLTGIYYLRCYTRWMRNWGQGFYCYLPLRILNPEKPEAEEREGGEAAVDLKVEKAMEKGFFEFSNCPPVLDRGDTVSMVIHVSQDYPFMEAEGCLTVVPLIAAPRPGMKVLQQTGEPANEAFRVKFLPDLNGVSVSGTVIEKGKADRAFSGQKIHMTLLGSRSDYLVSQIDEYGRFTVSLPQRHGNLELFVQPEDPGNSVTDIRIDQDFDPAQLYPPSKGFNIPDSQLQMITIMARNAQLSRIYSDQKPAENSQSWHMPFYGTPQFTVHMDDFVLLPTLEEVFINLVPVVTVARKKDTISMIVRSENPAITLYPPLIMIDEIPVFNMALFMSVSPTKIAVIDVVNDVYVKGDMRFGGIINLRSREGDMAGIELPANSFFFDYQAFQRPSIQENDGNSLDRQPDVRNTILWIPDLRTGVDSPTQFSFKAPAYPGEYTVLFRSTDGKGRYACVETSFHVR